MDKDWLVEQRERGDSAQQIADRLGVTRCAVRAALRRHDLDTHRRKRARTPASNGRRAMNATTRSHMSAADQDEYDRLEEIRAQAVAEVKQRREAERAAKRAAADKPLCIECNEPVDRVGGYVRCAGCRTRRAEVQREQRAALDDRDPSVRDAKPAEVLRINLDQLRRAGWDFEAAWVRSVELAISTARGRHSGGLSERAEWERAFIGTQWAWRNAFMREGPQPLGGLTAVADMLAPEPTDRGRIALIA
jgi:hypothetical protein